MAFSGTCQVQSGPRLPIGGEASGQNDPHTPPGGLPRLPLGSRQGPGRNRGIKWQKLAGRDATRKPKCFGICRSMRLEIHYSGCWGRKANSLHLHCTRPSAARPSRERAGRGPETGRDETDKVEKPRDKVEKQEIR